MSYYLRGYGGGLGATLHLPPPAVWIDPGQPASNAIVMRNLAANDAYQVAVAGAMAQYVLDQCHENANLLSGAQRDAAMATCAAAYSDAGAVALSTADTPVDWYTPPAASVSPANPAGSVPHGGRVTFTTSRGTGALQVGDTWLVAITGASPNSPVTVSGSMPTGPFSGSVMGSTDASGNYSKSGTASSSDLGAWQESWSVAGVPSGAFSFTISPATAPDVTFGKSGTPTPGGSPGSSSTVGGFDLASIPWWGWLGVGGVVLFAMKGGR